MRHLFLAFLAMLLWIGLAYPQANSRILTGNDATERFVYAGLPIHPFCLDFTQEGSSRSTPKELSRCSGSEVVPKNEGRGWWSAEYPRGENDRFISMPPYVSYRVLANKGDRFLIASDSSGGGSGQFSNLFWVRLEGGRIAVTKDEMGGDRCIGGLSDYRVQGATLVFSANAPSSTILELAGLKLNQSLTDNLHGGYIDCDGRALYRYNLKTEKYELTSVEVNTADALPDSPATEPQTCFDKVVRQYSKNKIARLKPEKLRELGRRFTAMCIPWQSAYGACLGSP